MQPPPAEQAYSRLRASLACWNALALPGSLPSGLCYLRGEILPGHLSDVGPSPLLPSSLPCHSAPVHCTPILRLSCFLTGSLIALPSRVPGFLFPAGSHP